MPEWNLVVKLPVKKYANVVLLVMLVALIQTGCSKLRQSTLDSGLLGTEQVKSSLTKDPLDSADRYIEDTQGAIDSQPQKDQARILGISDESIDPDKKQIKLVANPTALSKDSEASDPPCSHLAQCDCYKRQLKPKLPYAEPIEPPPMAKLLSPAAETLPQPAIKAPPTGVVSQRLAPILFDSETRMIEQDDMSDGAKNSLRRNEPWSHEKPAKIENKQEASSPEELPNKFSAMQTEPDLARPNPTDDRVSQQIRSTDWRDSNESGTASFEAQAFQDCDSCSSSNCDGSCANNARRNASHSPIVTDPVTIVASETVDIAPSFAGNPVNSQSENQMEIPLPKFVLPEVDPMVQVPVESSDDPVDKTDSVDASDDEQWATLWGPARWISEASQANDTNPKWDEPCCSACQSNPCLDPNCGQQESDTDVASHPAEPPQQNGFPMVASQAREISSNPQPTEPVEELPYQANPIEVTAAANSQNDFSPATHMTDIPNSESTEFRLPDTQFPSFAPRMPSPTLDPRTVFEVEPTDLESQPTPEPDKQTLQKIEPVSSTEFVPPASTDPTTAAPSTSTLPMLPVTNATVFVPDAGPMPLQNNLNNQDHPTGFVNHDEETAVSKISTMIVTPTVNITSAATPELTPVLDVNFHLLETLTVQIDEIQKQQRLPSESEQQYWQHQLEAISLALEAAGHSNLESARVTLAKEKLEHLKKSLEQFASTATLKVCNGEFCTEISGFGQYKPFPNSSFQAGQRLLIYCEVENYLSEARSSKFHTTLRGSFEIHDRQGRAVQQAQFAPVEDVSNARRRDFYMYFPIQLADLPPGEYTLNLSVEDTFGSQTASLESKMTFQVQ